jgi:hypothetical protein
MPRPHQTLLLGTTSKHGKPPMDGHPIPNSAAAFPKQRCLEFDDVWRIKSQRDKSMTCLTKIKRCRNCRHYDKEMCKCMIVKSKVRIKLDGLCIYWKES